jgi:hypothetical protein
VLRLYDIEESIHFDWPNLLPLVGRGMIDKQILSNGLLEHPEMCVTLSEYVLFREVIAQVDPCQILPKNLIMK